MPINIYFERVPTVQELERVISLLSDLAPVIILMSSDSNTMRKCLLEILAILTRLCYNDEWRNKGKIEL